MDKNYFSHKSERGIGENNNCDQNYKLKKKNG